MLKLVRCDIFVPTKWVYAQYILQSNNLYVLDKIKVYQLNTDLIVGEKVI